MSAVSTAAILLQTNNMLGDIPGLSLGVNVTSATSAVVVSSDGAVQVNGTNTGQAVVVDIYLFVDGDTTPRQIVQRRVYAVNNAIVPNIANWSFSVAVTGLAPGVSHTFRVAAAIIASNGGVAAIVGGSSAAPSNRATLTAVVVNK